MRTLSLDRMIEIVETQGDIIRKQEDIIDWLFLVLCQHISSDILEDLRIDESCLEIVQLKNDMSRFL